MVYISKIFRFEAAHFLPKHKSKCKNLHGHSYKMIITIKGPLQEDNGMVMDFIDLKKIVKKHIIEKYDHKLLNDFYENPTAEVLVVNIFHELSKYMPEHVKVHKVILYETETSFASYKGE